MYLSFALWDACMCMCLCMREREMKRVRERNEKERERRESNCRQPKPLQIVEAEEDLPPAMYFSGLWNRQKGWKSRVWAELFSAGLALLSHDCGWEAWGHDYRKLLKRTNVTMALSLSHQENCHSRCGWCFFLGHYASTVISTRKWMLCTPPASVSHPRSNCSECMCLVDLKTHQEVWCIEVWGM